MWCLRGGVAAGHRRTFSHFLRASQAVIWSEEPLTFHLSLSQEENPGFLREAAHMVFAVSWLLLCTRPSHEESPPPLSSSLYRSRATAAAMQFFHIPELAKHAGACGRRQHFLITSKIPWGCSFTLVQHPLTQHAFYDQPTIDCCFRSDQVVLTNDPVVF